jgi:hypothetical protein
MNVFGLIIVVVATILPSDDINRCIEWKRDYVENFKYTLVDEKKYLVFYFSDNDNVAVTYGVKNCEYISPMYEWKIDENGELVFYEPKKDVKNEVMRFSLIELSNDKVLVRNEGEEWVFQRITLPNK